MNLERLVTGMPACRTRLDLGRLQDLEGLKGAVIAMMNMSAVSTGRGTHYNSREEEVLARQAASKKLFEMDRGIFLMVHALNGVTDDAKRGAIKALLMNSRENYADSILDEALEMDGIKCLAQTLPPNRQLNLFCELKADRVNNRRTKVRLILPLLLNSDKLELWAVKYRRKLKAVLEHAWDKRTAGVIRTLLAKKRTLTEKAGLAKRIDAHLRPGTDRAKVYQCVSFILGNRGNFTLPKLIAFNEAKKDINKGSILPMEVLEGIRSTYHPRVDQKKILEIARGSMSEKKRSLVQRKAESAGVTVTFNPMARTALELYVLAFARGMTPGIRQALKTKGKAGARQLPVRFNRVGVLVDDSFSMTGSGEQKLRPMAAALAMKDILVNTSRDAVVKTASGRMFDDPQSLLRPVGATDLAMALVELLQAEVETVFIVSDGYENAPAGRVDEVMRLLEKIGCNTPVYHINPVAAAESAGNLRTLSERIPAIPAGSPDKLGLTMVRALIEVDLKRGLNALAVLALPKLTNGHGPSLVIQPRTVHNK